MDHLVFTTFIVKFACFSPFFPLLPLFLGGPQGGGVFLSGSGGSVGGRLRSSSIKFLASRR